MTASKPRFRSGSFFALLLLAASCCGCLKGNIFEFIVYDPSTDTFRYLQLDLNIASDTSADLAYLAELWDKREQIIVHPDIFRLWSLPAILRIDASHSHYKVINLGQADATSRPTLETSIPLDTIKVQPGKFFLTKDNTLAYYHEATASGKVVDEALAAQNKELFGPSLVEAIDKELKRRAAGGKSTSWAEIREQLIKGVESGMKKGARSGTWQGTAVATTAPTRTEKKNSAGSAPDAKAAPAPGSSPKDEKRENIPFDNASLESLRKAISAGEIGIHRRGAELELTLPLSPDDCRELKATIDVWNTETTRLLKAKPGDYTTSLYGGLRVEDDGGQRLIVIADLMALSKLQELTYTEAKSDPQLAGSYRNAIAALRSRSIPIDDKLTPKKIIDDFTAKKP
jgi:hypothetical protein